MTTNALQDIMTEDHVIVHEGDHVYNYYDMCPGTIRTGTVKESGVMDGAEVNIRKDLWFTFIADKGGTSILNGERIVTDAYAKRRGFPDA